MVVYIRESSITSNVITNSIGDIKVSNQQAFSEWSRLAREYEAKISDLTMAYRIDIYRISLDHVDKLIKLKDSLDLYEDAQLINAIKVKVDKMLAISSLDIASESQGIADASEGIADTN